MERSILMTTTYIKQNSFTNDEGQNIDYKRLAVVGEIDGQDQEVLIALNKLQMLLAEIILSKDTSTVNYQPLQGLVLEGTVNNRREKLVINLDKDQEVIVRILFAGSGTSAAQSAADGAGQSDIADELYNNSGRTSDDKIDLNDD